MPAAAPANPAKPPKLASADAAPLCCCCGGIITVFAVKMGVISKLTTMANVVVMAGTAKSVFFSSPKAIAKSSDF